MKTLYIDQTGPLVRYDGELLHIADLNPEIETRWRMSRMEMLRFGWKCILAALQPCADSSTEAVTLENGK